MANWTTIVSRAVRSIVLADTEQQSDRDLLARFASHGDQDAFAVLVRRHGPVVLGVCRRVLTRTQDAEDATQAVFVLLARRAKNTSWHPCLAGWFYTTARNVAWNARLAARCRTRHEQRVSRAEPVSPLDAVTGRELLAILDEELDRLPSRYREPLVLCYLEGLSREQAAARLSVPGATLKSQLERGRKKLADALTARGCTLSALLLLASGEMGRASFQLVDSILPAIAGPTPEKVGALLQGVALKGTLAKTKLLAVLGVSAVLIGLGLASNQPSSAQPQRGNAAIQAEKKIDEPAVQVKEDGSVARIGTPHFRHSHEVTAIAHSHDGRWLASLSMTYTDASARLWDAETGKERFRVKIDMNHLPKSGANAPGAVAFSPDSANLVVIDAATVRAFEIPTGKERWRHRVVEPARPPETQPLIGASLAADGKTFALAWEDGRLAIGDSETGKVLRTGQHPYRRFDSVAVEFSSDNALMLVKNPAYSAHLFDARTGERIRKVEECVGVRFLPDGKTLAGRSTREKTKERVVVFHEAKSGRKIRETVIDERVETFAVSGDGKLIAAAQPYRMFTQLIDAESGREVGRLPSLPSLMSMSFAPRGKSLAGFRCFSGAVSVWDLSKRDYHPASPDPIWDAYFTADERKILVWNRGWTLLDWRSGKIVSHPEPLRGHELDPLRSEMVGLGPLVLELDRKWFAVWRGSNEVRLVDARTGKEIRTLRGQTGTVRRIAESTTGGRIASINDSGSIVIWNQEGAEQARFTVSDPGHLGSLSISGDGRTLVADFYQDEESGTVIYTWDIDAKKPLARIKSPVVIKGRFGISPDGCFLAAGPEKGKGLDASLAVRLWDIRSGKELHLLPGHASIPYEAGFIYPTCDFSPDGRWLLTGDCRGGIRLWEVATGKELRMFEGHEGHVHVRFSASGRLFLGRSEEAPAYLWDVFGPPPTPNGGFDSLWNGLADPDPKMAFQAMRSMMGNPDATVSLLRKKLLPVPEIGAKQLDQLLRDLGDERFPVREQATSELTKVVVQVERKLRDVRETASSEDAKQRIDAVLKEIDPLTLMRLRQARAVQVLELLGTADAQKWLARIAEGAKSEPLTQAAEGAVKRLQAR